MSAAGSPEKFLTLESGEAVNFCDAALVLQVKVWTQVLTVLRGLKHEIPADKIQLQQRLTLAATSEAKIRAAVSPEQLEGAVNKLTAFRARLTSPIIVGQRVFRTVLGNVAWLVKELTRCTARFRFGERGDSSTTFDYGLGLQAQSTSERGDASEKAWAAFLQPPEPDAIRFLLYTNSGQLEWEIGADLEDSLLKTAYTKILKERIRA